ncbi:N-acetylglucosamine-6-phosphate deacetylase [Dolichospermum circinale]|uniref:N-acetylglucosamine-6-phosphate deacetylase n=1 Tax=Dolichospermum circinale TaxID=109265 RepID=UPI000423F0E4|nr:N-acetylglucosamine-6-phosphate deacetylase [Dolichospermum circinale]MDB9481346.1 N-acetylglucosamine-6-phosphate deacetylase [Dolichospermum circinale CS-537/05]MDB9453166.1 N-acetylglucosamine-6-phosphate deacetylase [Dolichospermum circinale CS-541/06]MDB9464913.1 N-acetylglucosamine-6-phosphate deacetylase [Dolichospermum circinale CS-541/04]MDB9475886.1 N-acetylglucosamine-6-phosphate deacetylase [Dolichospermum circinale CS-537/11]MDB9480303.1 N-acetylglucosamine-6-phosphate deacetyl
MPANINIINAKVPGYQDLQRILVNQEGIIDSIMPMSTVWQEIIPQHLLLDVAGDWISLGGVDLQINGGLGLAFPELTLENSPNLAKISSFLWSAGVDAYLPTLVTTSIENLHRSLAILTDYTSNSPNSAQILGVHLEGPFLNYYKRGAHPSEYLLPLTIDQVKRVLGDYAPIVKLITIAPELDTTGKVIPYLRSLGITVSLGHSQATAAESQQAFSQGATMITHAFNAMPPLHHREPGLLGAAINDPRVFCGFIADGQHVNPMILKILLRASKSLFIVSDALAPLGLPDGIYPWDNRQIEVTNGTARLQDGTLTGTTLPLLIGVQNLVKWQVCDIETAIDLATNAPRKAIDLPTFSPHQPAHLLRWNYDPVGKELSWQRLTF